MKILIINCGSSTVKFQVIETAATKDRAEQRQRKLAHGLVERIGERATCAFSRLAGQPYRSEENLEDHEAAVRKIMDWLDAAPKESGIGAGALAGVGHRVVHGGDEFTAPVVIDERVIAGIEALNELAPLHNPAALSGIRAARRVLGTSIPMVAAFDTSFHHTIPEPAAIYAIPLELSKKYRIRRYGFHGLAHQYSLLRYGELAGKSPDKIKLITMHLGNGCSATAIRDGISVDTSMGFTPLEGLVMGTRSGDLDPALMSYLARKENVDAAEIEKWLNQRSGLLGLSGLSNDMRELTNADEQNARARLAIDVFCYRARKYLGGYLAALDGADAVVFSGGIGENAPRIREMVCRGMEWAGLRLDAALNHSVTGRDGRISPAASERGIYVVHSDEEAMIARESVRLIAEINQVRQPRS